MVAMWRGCSGRFKGGGGSTGQPSSCLTVQDVFDGLGHEGHLIIHIEGLIVGAAQLDLRL